MKNNFLLINILLIGSIKTKFQSRLLKCSLIAKRELVTSGNSAITITIVRQREESVSHGTHLLLTLEKTKQIHINILISQYEFTFNPAKSSSNSEDTLSEK